MALSLKSLKSVFLTNKYEQEFGSLLDFVAQTLEYIGLNFQRKTWHDNFKDKFKTYLLFSPILCFFSLCLNELFFSSNSETLVFSFLGFALGLITLPKAATIFLYHSELRSLTENVAVHTKYSYTLSSVELDLRIKYTGIASIITKILAFCFTSAAAACIIIPIFVTNQWILPFPYKIVGLSNNSHPGYDIHYVFVVAIIGYIYFLQLGYDLSFYYFSIFVAFRMDICKYMASQIGDETLSYNKQREMLLRTINLHMDTTKFIKDCSVTIALVIFFQSIGTLLMITVCLYTWMVNPSAFWLLAFLNSITTQFFIYCYFGQLIVTKVTEVSNSLYCSKWYNFSSSNDRKIILFFLSNSQTMVCFTGYGLFDLSFEAFTQVCKAALGYYTFLTNVM